jgi:hypothetical protein
MYSTLILYIANNGGTRTDAYSALNQRAGSGLTIGQGKVNSNFG